MIKDLEAAIGYRFQNITLLQNALTHSSYANERWHNSLLSNERLEFLGDSVLNMLAAEHLYTAYPELPEGELTKLRASVVCETSLYTVALAADLGKYLLLGKGEDANGGRNRASILADATEALIAAIYLDGGLEAAREFIIPRLQENIKTAVAAEFYNILTSVAFWCSEKQSHNIVNTAVFINCLAERYEI